MKQSKQAKKPKPSYPLKDVKDLIKANKFHCNNNATMDAYDDFGWKTNEIKKCLLKLNDRYHLDNLKENHFYKSEPHNRNTNIMVDIYRAINIMDGFNVYTHFYIHPNFGNLIISSFKELEYNEMRTL